LVVATGVTVIISVFSLPAGFGDIWCKTIVAQDASTLRCIAYPNSFPQPFDAVKGWKVQMGALHVSPLARLEFVDIPYSHHWRGGLPYIIPPGRKR
jgi:hypothetical protein